jgi:hypothetical protein
MTLELKEADIKQPCEVYLKSLMYMGKLLYFRLNAGNMLIPNGDGTNRMYRGAPKGTSDGLVMTKDKNIFVEYKRPVGGKQTREQLAFERKVCGMGFEYWLVSDSQAFMDAIGEII